MGITASPLTQWWPRGAASTAMLAGLAGIALFAGAPRVVGAAASVSNSDLSRLETEVERLEAARAVKHLQRAYGFYMDRGLWRDAADLFAPDATFEVGADGVYVGRDRIAEYLRRAGGGGTGLPWGILADHYQLQPVVHVSADGRTAKARWRDFGLLGEYGKSASWEEGIFENEYVKRDGVWMIQSLHLYVSFIVPYEKGWARASSAPADNRSRVAREFPPDRPPSAPEKRFPESQIVPFHYPNPAQAAPLKEPPRTANAELARYWKLAQRLQSEDEIENLQGIYGYYFDKNLWSEVAALFTAGATFEYGQRGVYVGRAHIEQALKLFGPPGPQRGWLNNAFQLQPVIHVSDDGRTAKGRWESIMQLARPNSGGQWGLGVYENEYALEGGRWKISKLHFYVTALADYDLMWSKGPQSLEGPSAILPPDRPPTEIYRSLPGVYIPPFHYRHPVTGKPIVTDPQPADSILRPR
ncbi:MAG TPA: nuclear transport factor 2 family protein [Steroidobacteraceae bacterium]|nr:nuclear transport factor 2 family protein [Steroidobacteraceae bacterium]